MLESILSPMVIMKYLHLSEVSLFSFMNKFTQVQNFQNILTGYVEPRNDESTDCEILRSSNSSSNATLSSPSDSHESSSSSSSDESSASFPSHNSPLKRACNRPISVSSRNIDSKAKFIQEPLLLACQSDFIFVSAAPVPGLYPQTSIADDNELSDVVDWDNFSVDLAADENQDKFNCPFINYEAQESSGDDCIETNEQFPSRKLNSQSRRKIQSVDYSSRSDENDATHGLA